VSDSDPLLSQTVSIGRLIEEARKLKCKPGEENPAYDRGLYELIQKAAGLGPDRVEDALRILDLIGI